jgi:inner membrane protein
MPSIFTHSIAAAALGALGRPSDRMPARFWVASALAAVVPDADVVAFGLDIPYASIYGHRGFSHSLMFAAILAALVVSLMFRETTRPRNRLALWALFFLVIASHGILDAMTTGGSGVAFFAPFSAERYFFPWRPILVSPIGVAGFVSSRGVAVLANELQWVWLPSAAVAAIGWIIRGRRGRRVTVQESGLSDQGWQRNQAGREGL